MRNKPVAVIGASTSAFGGVWAQAELRKVLGALGARVLDVELAVSHAHERFDQFGRLTDGNFLEQLTAVVDSLVLAVDERAARTQLTA
jgi:chromate reductase, NAD(P)H dehydrogenase (quinone)